MPNKIKPVLLFCLSVLFLTDNSVKAGKSVKLTDAKGYTEIVYFQSNFVAIGTNGRIDRINKSGNRITVDSSYSSYRYNLTCAFVNEELLIVAGEQGTILYSIDGKRFYSAVSGTEKSINGITYRNGLFIAGTDGGIILTSKNGKSWNTAPIKVKGNILSLSSNNSFSIGVSDAGEILKSSDGINWEIKDYNKEYAGYTKYSKFKKVLATQSSAIIIGTHDDNSPSILFSTMGNVWAERTPLYHGDEGEILYLTQNPNGITYDPEQDQFILACDNGIVFTLPSCNKCNKHLKISETNLKAITYLDKSILIVGDDFSVFVQKL